MDYQELSKQARSLKKELAQYERSEAQYYRGIWMDSAKQRGHRYYRLRASQDGKTVLVRSLKADEVEEVRALVKEARTIERIERKLRQVKGQLDRVVARAAKIGITLKHPLEGWKAGK